MGAEVNNKNINSKEYIDSTENIDRRKKENEKLIKQLDKDFETNGYTQNIKDAFSGNTDIELKINENETINIDISEKWANGKKNIDGKSDLENILGKVKAKYKGEEKGFNLKKTLKDTIKEHGFNGLPITKSYDDYKILNEKIANTLWEKINNNYFGEDENNNSVQLETPEETPEKSETPEKQLETPEKQLETPEKKLETPEKKLETVEKKLETVEERSDNLNNDIIYDNDKIDENTEDINQNFEQLKEKTIINNPQAQLVDKLLTGENHEKAIEFLKKGTKESPKKISNENSQKVFNQKNEKLSTENKAEIVTFLKNIKKIPENREKIPKENIENFKKDFSELSDIAKEGINSPNIDILGEGPYSHKIMACERIQENYIKISEDVGTNKNIAIEIAGSSIIQNIESGINESNKTIFKNAVNNLYSKNPEKKFEGLSELIRLEQADILNTAKKFIKTYPKAKKTEKGTKDYKAIRSKLNNKKSPILTKLSKKVREGFEIFGNTNERFNKILESIKDTIKQQTISQKEINESISEIIKEGNGAIKEN